MLTLLNDLVHYERLQSSRLVYCTKLKFEIKYQQPLTYLNLEDDEEIYEADVGGISSVHDRACELYQQIVGIMKVRANAEKNHLEVAEQVYGAEQVRTKHRCTFYKPRYLRKCNSETGQTFAHTGGITNWSEKNKIHLVGHSLGAQTIRYFQYLLKIGYFDDEYKGVDRSNWIASINCISAPMNGATITHNFGFSQKSNRFKKNSWAVKLLKYKVITGNLLSVGGTQNKMNDQIVNKKVR